MPRRFDIVSEAAHQGVLWNPASERESLIYLAESNRIQDLELDSNNKVLSWRSATTTPIGSLSQGTPLDAPDYNSLTKCISFSSSESLVATASPSIDWGDDGVNGFIAYLIVKITDSSEGVIFELGSNGADLFLGVKDGRYAVMRNSTFSAYKVTDVLVDTTKYALFSVMHQYAAGDTYVNMTDGQITINGVEAAEFNSAGNGGTSFGKLETLRLGSNTRGQTNLSFDLKLFSFLEFRQDLNQIPLATKQRWEGWAVWSVKGQMPRDNWLDLLPASHPYKNKPPLIG